MENKLSNAQFVKFDVLKHHFFHRQKYSKINKRSKVLEKFEFKYKFLNPGDHFK